MNTEIFTIEDEPRKAQYEQTGFSFTFNQADQLATLKAAYIEAHGRYSKHWEQLDTVTNRLSKIPTEFLAVDTTTEEDALLQEQTKLTNQMNNLPTQIASLFKQMAAAHLQYLKLEAERRSQEFEILDNLVTTAIDSTWTKDAQAKEAGRKGQKEAAVTLYGEINQIKVDIAPFKILRGYVKLQCGMAPVCALNLYNAELTNPGMWPRAITLKAREVLKNAQRKIMFVPT